MLKPECPDWISLRSLATESDEDVHAQLCNLVKNSEGCAPHYSRIRDHCQIVEYEAHRMSQKSHLNVRQLQTRFFSAALVAPQIL